MDEHELEVEVLTHSYDNRCRLCASKWLRDSPTKYEFDSISHPCLKKEEYVKTEHKST